ncbi:PREDICTED: zinc finger BED domain-containing protein RICESLEEPER 2-like [Lupinus angustifolius]|uniref:zinc finger BED domain-containing protein RICESLEEPER 2-like n=1 Tax=Lupinus angustifolius TaxID=3871 RepID=UPI00092E53F2|nr:PREDICTED: zinc finger BED domain-containing protein RICESLEEPER 2-like [Lupinus angustifolius]
MEDWNSHPLKGEHFQVRCCVHIINPVVTDGLKDLHDSISKIRSAVRYVRASPSRLDRFKIYIKETRMQDVRYVQLDVPTRWNSTYTMLENAIKFQKGFKRLGERDNDFASMQGGVPKNDDWNNAKYITKFLKIFYDITTKMSGSTYVTSSLYFNERCVIMMTLEKWIGNPDALLGTMAIKMKAKYNKYWGDIKKMNVMIFIVVILDPQNKFHFVKWGLERILDKDDVVVLYEKINDTLYKMFDKYRLFLSEGQKNSAQATQ